MLVLYIYTSYFIVARYQIHMVSLHKVQHVFHNTCYVPTRRYYRRKILGPIPLLALLETGP